MYGWVFMFLLYHRGFGFVGFLLVWVVVRYMLGFIFWS